jgi:hypothetical protein
MIELGKEYKTRDGRSVRVHTTTAQCNLGPVIGEYETGGNWVLEVWDERGRTRSVSTDLDLIEVKPTRVFEAWVNVYVNGARPHYCSQQEADRYRGEGCIACLHIRHEYQEGDGL